MHQILGMKRSASVKAGSRAASQRMGRQRGMNVSLYLVYTSSFAVISGVNRTRYGHDLSGSIIGLGQVRKYKIWGL